LEWLQATLAFYGLKSGVNHASLNHE